MKKLISFLLILSILCLFAGCGDTPASDVDYDLSTMTNTMMNAQIDQMELNPDEYMNKTVKMTGTFNAYTVKGWEGVHYACVVKDPTACCDRIVFYELAGGASVGISSQNTKFTVMGTFSFDEEIGFIILKNAKYV